jgi:glycosyltransferase involved in cell wall biosynthesis
MRLLYYSPNSYGGLADYAHEQANALVDLGIEVELLATSAWRSRHGEQYGVSPILSEATSNDRVARWRSRLKLGRSIMHNASDLAARIRGANYRHVLFGSFTEYLAPFWAGRLKRLADRGVVFGAVIHDPVRDFVVGPLWWHRRSVAAGYSFLREAFVHEQIDLDTVRRVPALRTTVIPHGPYLFSQPTRSRQEVRQQLNIPLSSPLLLAFGHVRDDKNLDLALHALADLPEVHLLVAGKAQSDAQKPVAWYRQLAGQLQIERRCHWIDEYIDPSEVGNLFTAADLVLLTYRANFRSASGVQNIAAFYQKPCVASSGEGNLASVIRKYDLGVFIEGRDLKALSAGIRRAIESPPAARWDDYLRENSWRRNAELVLAAFQSRDD